MQVFYFFSKVSLFRFKFINLTGILVSRVCCDFVLRSVGSIPHMYIYRNDRVCIYICAHAYICKNVYYVITFGRKK